MVRHADDLVRNDLSGRDDEVILLIHDAAVDLYAYGLGPYAAGDFGNGLGRNLAKLDNVRTPAMDNHFCIRDVWEHDLPLLLGHRHMGAERGHHINLHAFGGKKLVIYAGDETGVGVVAGEIRRYDENVLEFASFKRLLQQDGDFIVCQTFGLLCYRKEIHIGFLSS